MKTISTAYLLFASAALCYAAPLPRSTPESQGVSSPQILAFVEAANKQIESMNSFMLLRHGHVVAEGWWSPYNAASPHTLFSLSKSFCSTAVGLAIAEGKLSLDDKVLKFFPDDAPADPSENLKAMRVRDLLSMSGGDATEPPRPLDRSWVKTFLAWPVKFKPGTHFLYNTSGTYMLSAIVQKATGMTVLDYLRPRLFEPLGIEHPTWQASPQGISAGGFGLSIRTEDIARFGQLYLQKGEWQGKQLVPADWVAEATSRHITTDRDAKGDWGQGYGYQFWRCRHGAYRGDGAFGQYCIVLPEQDAVLVITSGVKDMQQVLNIAWDKLLPALKSAALAEDDAAREKLLSKLKSLALPPVAGEGKPADVFGKTFAFASNRLKLESIALSGGEKEGDVTIVVKHDGREQKIVCTRGGWHAGQSVSAPLPLESTSSHTIAASGAWTAEGVYTAKLCLYETPFIVTIKLKYAGPELQCDAAVNVNFGPTEFHATAKAE